MEQYLKELKYDNPMDKMRRPPGHLPLHTHISSNFLSLFAELHVNIFLANLTQL